MAARNKKQDTEKPDIKKVQSGNSAQNDELPCLPQPDSIWPVSFAPPKKTAIIVGILIAFSLILLLLAMGNNLLWAKRLLGYIIGVPAYELLMLDAMSWDIFIVAVALIWFIGGALIHPAIGLGIIIIVRPLLDGYTYPMDNMYFIWAILAITALWNLRLLFQGGTIVGKKTTLILLLFLFSALAVMPASYQWDNTYLRLILWFSLACLFFTVLNTLRDRSALGVLLGAFVISLGIEALYSILNYYYLLPYLRNALVSSAELRMQYFGVDEFTPELARRFNINRAFGSMLFPNALAAYMILGIPGTAAVSWYLYKRYKSIVHLPHDIPYFFNAFSRQIALGLGLCTWLICLLVFFFIQQFPIMYALTALPFYLQGAIPFVTSLVLATIPAFLIFRKAIKSGVYPALVLSGLCTTSLILVFQIWTLLVTYSRGGMLALFIAVLITCVIIIIKFNKSINFKPIRPLLNTFLIGISLLYVAIFLFQSIAPGVAEAQSQTTIRDTISRIDSRSVVTDRGTDITISELADPASMRLRVSYWRVGMRMFLDNPWTGVGLGNFGVAYPVYQGITDGDVREAHNSFLQIFCETGIVGGILFILFWCVVLLSMISALLKEQDRLHFILLAGGFCGLLAFLGHAFIDINFSHPGLGMLVMTWAGLWLAFAKRHELVQPEKNEGRSTVRSNPDSSRIHFIALPVLFCVALLLGLSLRPYLQELALARMQFIGVSGKANEAYNRKYQILSLFYLGNVATYAHTGEGQRPNVPVSDAMYLGIPLEDIVERGTIYQRIPETGGARRLPEGSPVPLDAVVLVNRLWPAYYDAVEAFERYLQFLAFQFRRFPYNVDLAYNIAHGYERLVHHVDLPMRPELRKRFLEQLEYWSTQTITLSPRNKDMRLIYAKMLWHRGLLAEAGVNLDDLRASVDQYKEAAALAPAAYNYVATYASMLRQLAEELVKQGETEEAAILREHALKMDERFIQITRARIGVGLM